MLTGVLYQKIANCDSMELGCGYFCNNHGNLECVHMLHWTDTLPKLC